MSGRGRGGRGPLRSLPHHGIPRSRRCPRWPQRRLCEFRRNPHPANFGTTPSHPKAYFALKTSQRKQSSLFASQDYTSPLFVYHKLNFPSAVETGIKRSPNKSTEHSLQFPLEVRLAINTPLPPSPLFDPNYAFSSWRCFCSSIYVHLKPWNYALPPPKITLHYKHHNVNGPRYLYHKITVRLYLCTTSLTFLPPWKLE
jgi:hypothetical protein